MILSFSAFSPTIYCSDQVASGAFEERISLDLTLEAAGFILASDGADLADYVGTIRIQSALEREMRSPNETPINAVFWNDPAKDDPAGTVTYFSVQLEVSPSLYFAILVTMNAPGMQLSLELEVPDLDAVASMGTVQFEDLYMSGMSRVSMFALSVTHGGTLRPLLPETWPAAVGPMGVPGF